MNNKNKKYKNKIKRNPKSKAKPYFTKEVQESIKKFLEENNNSVRESIYIENIMPAFSKLIENLINVYKFSGIDSYDEIKTDCMTFLFETMRKFDHTRGTNAFSYFNVVAKNWLIIRSKQKANSLKVTVNIDDENENLNSTELKIIEDYHTLESQDKIFERDERINNMLEVIDVIKTRLKNESELLCISAIRILFENIEDIDLLSKSAIFIYIKELSGLSQKQLTSSLHVIKNHYRSIKSEKFLELFC